MGLVRTFDDGAIAAQVQAYQILVEKAAITLMQYLGEGLVKYAKAMHNYTDRTGNLTNSIGYVVAKGTEIVFNGCGSEPGIAADSALRAAMKMLEDLPNRISLIVVAGMKYAVYVEAKGYNVILPAELKAKTDFPKAMQKLMDKAKDKANELFGTEI